MTTPYNVGVDNTEKVYEKSNASKIQTDLSDTNDVARVKLGNGWRMPTQTELIELLYICDWEWQPNFNGSGHNGYKVMKKDDHNIYIFLPAAGGVDGLSQGNDGFQGYYWTISFDSHSGCWAVYLGSSKRNIGSSWRHYGFSVRPVRD